MNTGQVKVLYSDVSFIQMFIIQIPTVPRIIGHLLVLAQTLDDNFFSHFEVKVYAKLYSGKFEIQ